MELSVLLDPGITLQDWTELPERASLHRQRNLILCSLLPKGDLRLTALQGSQIHLNGPFTQFLWEDGYSNESVLDRDPRLLTLSQNNEFCVYEVGTEGGQVTVTTVCLCTEDVLRQLCADNHVCVPSLPSVHLLSLDGDDILFLLSNSVFVHLCCNGQEQKPIFVSCFCLDLDPEAAERITDVCLRKEMLFLLDSLGFIYAFDSLDGSLVTDLAVPMRMDKGTVEPLNSIHVSPNLDLIIVLSDSDCFVPLKLNEKCSDKAIRAIRYKKNLKSVQSLEHNTDMRINGTQQLGHSFRMDRSWDAMLSSLFKEIPVCPQAPSLFPCSISSAASLSWTVVGEGWVKVLTDNENEKDFLGLHIWSVSSSSALFCLKRVDGCIMLVHWNMETLSVNYHALGIALCVDCTCDETCLIITDRGLSLILFEVSQNEFLTRLMIHGSASTADTLCHLNSWGRCSVPLHTLEAGLENRQLDTVDFFLKSKESILIPLTSESSEAADVQSEQYLHSVQDLVPALDLLFFYIHDTDKETQSKHFSEQLLQLTLHFLNGQVVALCSLLAEPDPLLEQCVGILIGYITKLRPFMRRFHQQPFPVQAPQPGRGPRAWENMCVENIISDAILMNCIPEAQTFLRIRGHHAASLRGLKREGLKLVYKCLVEKRVMEACKLLQNMGYSIWGELRRICLHTSDLGVRTLLVDLLQKEGHFSEHEQEQIHTMCQLEELSAGQRQKVPYSRPSWKISTLCLEAEALQNALIDIGDVSGILLHWAQGWDRETQESILLPQRSSTDMSTVTPKILWRHLTLWHDWSSIDSWLESIGRCETEDKEHSLWPHLRPEVVEEDTLCCSYARQIILDKLSSMKIFIPSAMNDFEQLVERFAVSGRLMPVSTVTPESISAEQPEFHSRFVLLCVERGLQYMLYTYLDYHRLYPEVCSALANTSLHETCPWFGLLVHIRQVGANKNDANQMFHASLSNAHMLMPGYQPSVNSMLLEGHTLLALATNMYAPGGIDMVLEEREDPSMCQSNVDAPLLKMALAPYPKLRAALFPQHPASCGSPPDVSLYHLLQALSPFNPTHFFTWQGTNSLAAGDNNAVLPHCSCPKLVGKLSAGEQLDVFFHLRSGRPAVAFSTFLVHQLLKSKTPQQLIHQASEDVYSLALSCFNVPSVVASCVCFLELIGVSSQKLRVDVSVAKLILKHGISLQEEPGNNGHMQVLAQKLSKLVENEIETAKDLLLNLEEVVAAALQEDSPPPCRGLWVTMAQFCLLHSIPMSSMFLQSLAQKQDWLQLLVHAHSQEQAFSVLGDLNPVLSNHVALAMQDEAFSDCGLQGVSSETNTDSLHHVLLQCLNSAEPGQMLLKECVRRKVPFFSVLAACTQDTDCISCFCAWIATSVDEATYTEITSTLSAPTDHKRDLDDLTLTWDVLMGRKQSTTLHKAFSIFIEDCPLLPLLEMYDLCLHYKNYPEATAKMVDFQNCFSKFQSMDSSSSLPVLWIQNRASQLLQFLLLQSQTPYELRNVLRLLCDSGSQQYCGGKTDNDCSCNYIFA